MNVEKTTQSAPAPTATAQNSSSGGSTGNGNGNGASTSELGDRFMTLLTAQLTNQDPTEPMDSSELTAQMAQLAQLEQAEKTNSQLANLGSIVANVGNITSMGIVGSDARIAVDKFDWNAAQGSEINGTIMTDEQNLDRDYQVVVKDEDGNKIKTIDAKLENGKLIYGWDGTDENGNKVDSGEYQFEVGYTNEDGAYVKDDEAVATVASKISSMQFWPISETGLSNGMSVKDAMILEIMDSGSNSSSDTVKPETLPAE
ncbi:flagellar hook assembly protein FlgD [Vibrio sp. D431a]|uniref:flagellar hook assembly protein FlgD n=1 Tax=Vibrio sp. D431a TaxID=2837388 RepID=UPI00255576C6|nr:flagellar hook capping FlgD N-terminal domain-containing protein [Vibrio sp. D431a]MDK9793907.1 hypothetical protein [Vibrio sp. D431a]